MSSSSPSSSSSSSSAPVVVGTHRATSIQHLHANSNHLNQNHTSTSAAVTAADLINNNCTSNSASPTKNKLNHLINLVEEDRSSCKRIKLSESIENLNTPSRLAQSENNNNKIEIDQEQTLPIISSKHLASRVDNQDAATFDQQVNFMLT